MSLYQALSEIKNTSELKAFRGELLDRFGKLPNETEALLESMKLKWLAQRLGLERMVLKKQKFLGYFITNPESAFYSSAQFKYLLQQVQKSEKITMKEKQSAGGVKLLIVITDISTVAKVLHTLEPLELVTVSSDS